VLQCHLGSVLLPEVGTDDERQGNPRTVPPEPVKSRWGTASDRAKKASVLVVGAVWVDERDLIGHHKEDSVVANVCSQVPQGRGIAPNAPNIRDFAVSRREAQVHFNPSAHLSPNRVHDLELVEGLVQGADDVRRNAGKRALFQD
jgi:hypothetical protein